jgi:hypothetical protein
MKLCEKAAGATEREIHQGSTTMREERMLEAQHWVRGARCFLSEHTLVQPLPHHLFPRAGFLELGIGRTLEI